MKISRFIWLLPLVLAACHTPPPPIVTKIDSEPPGARIFVSFGTHVLTGDALGREYIGSTPCTYTCPQEDGTVAVSGVLLQKTFMVPPLAVFYAEPPSGATNLHAKHQAFHSGALLIPADAVPHGLFFDLTKP